MASPIPGTLLHLLQSMSSPSPASSRPTLLQVIGIVPAASGGPDLWPSHGFHLQLSDSLNSTYVSLSDCDAAASLSDRPQLGHLLLVDRLIPAHPLPRASGVRPVPSPRPLPLTNPPDPLIVRTGPDGAFLIQPAPSPSPPRILANININTDAPLKRRSSSPSAPSRKLDQRDPYPALRVRSRQPSPVPAKAAVPSLVAAKTEGGRAGRDSGVVIPSRYRQPSPVGGHKGAAAQPVVRRSVGSPGRRLSVGAKGSPASGDGGGKRLSVAGSPKIAKEIGCAAGIKVAELDLPGTQAALSSQSNNGSSEEEVSISEKQNTGDRTESFTIFEKQNTGDRTESFNIFEKLAPNITVHDRKWTDGSIPLNNISESLAKLGKEALQRRNLASIAAREALEEALATDSIIRSLSMFSDLCSSSKSGNPLSTIHQFLSLYNDFNKCTSIIESLASNPASNGASGSMSIERRKSFSLWVEAALATDLQVLSLLDSGTASPPKQKPSLKPALDHPRASLSKRHSAKSHPKVWSRGYGVGETVELTRILGHEMRTWFLKFVEEAVDGGFRGVCSDNDTRTDNNKLAAVISHLKRVNEWLDVARKEQEEEPSIEKIERLKRKIYGFVINHVGSAFDSSVSPSEA